MSFDRGISEHLYAVVHIACCPFVPSVQEALASVVFSEWLEGPQACAVWLKKCLTF